MESKKENPARKKKSFLARAGKVILWIVGCLIFLVILILILIQTAPVQNFARKKIVSYLENKLKTRVEIGKLDVKFPTALSLQNIFVEDQSKDTLLYGGELKVNISMLKLLKSDIEIQEIALNNMVAKVKRLPPDSTFNFQFIVDAFAGNPGSASQSKDTSSLNIHIDRILVHNTRIIYKDAYTGNDMNLAIGDLDTKIKTFDPSHLLFDVPSISLNGLHGYFYQVEPLKQSVKKTVSEAAAQPDNYLQFVNKEMNFSNINVDYKSDPSNLNSSFVIGKLVMHPKTIDLKNSIITLKNATLDNSTVAVETSSGKTKQTPRDTVLTTAPTPPFKILSDELAINNSNLKYDDNSLPHTGKGMDFSHLYLTDLSLQADGLTYSIDTTIVAVKSAKFKEQSGFVLSDLATDFEMNATGVSLQNLHIVTPGSEIQRSALISYPSLTAIQKNPGKLGLDINLVDSKISLKDVQTFLPSLSTRNTPLSSHSTLYVNARVTGKVSDLHLEKIILRGLSSTDINASGIIKGLPDTKHMYADLNINKFQTSRNDILTLIPAGYLPSNINLPQNISANGKIKGGMDNISTNLAINTSLGNAKISGTLVNITDSNRANYNLVLNASGVQLGSLMKNPKLGVFTGNFNVKGHSYNPRIANATFDGNIEAITLNSYTYRHIKTSGSIANKTYKIKADITDPNLTANLSANGEFAGKFPGIRINATIDSIKTFPLHLTPNQVVYHGDINGNFTDTDPDHLSGNLWITHSILVNDGQRITFDSLQVRADNTNGVHSLNLRSDFVSLSIVGQYKLTQLADVLQQSIEPYFSMTSVKRNIPKIDPYHFTINAGIDNNPALKAFFPSLTEFKPITLKGTFASDSGFNVYIKSAHIVYAATTIEGLNITAGTKNNLLAFNAGFKQIKNGTALSMYATTLDGTLVHNKLDFTLNIKDQKSVDKYNLGGTLDILSANNYDFSLKPGTLLLNYDKWSINNGNSIQYHNSSIIASNFILSQANQQLSLNSIGTGNNSPLQANFTNFQISTLTGFVESDSLLVNGLLNGTAVIKNIQTQPTFTTDLTIKSLSIYQDTVGDFIAKVNNNIANTYHADLSLTGYGNNVNINGDYIVKPTNSSYNFIANITALQMSSIEGFTKGAIKNARGSLYGKIAFNGSLQSPNIDGNISFDSTAFNVSALNNVFRIDKAAIAIINNKGIELRNFIVRDTINNELAIGGAINTPDFINYTFDLTVKAREFQAINSTKKDNNLFYGKMVFSTNLIIKGTPTHPVVTGNLSIDNKTDFTVVMPQQQPGVEKREGIVRFVDYSATAEDSLLMIPYDSLNVSPLIGYDISVNISVNSEATFNLIVDAANGDFLKLKGTGQLTAGIDASGKITMVGSYEINEGSYNLSFNFLKRDFSIQKGSRIVWTGEPTTAQIDVTAIYIANTAPLDLVPEVTADQVMYKQKLPFEVHLRLTGELLKPTLSFDIVLPTDKNYNVSNDIITTVQNKLIQVRQDPGEMNKQVFALLLLNRFVGQNPFASSGGSSINATTFAMQSVSRLLSEQLNALTENLIQGVDINFDLATTQDYTTGSQQNRTDLNIGITKRLLSDRLSVTVGSDFELQGPQPATNQQQNFAGNISINYKLSKDGKYMIRAYRKNDYTDIIDGYVIETGVAFIISVDYNKFKELFTTKEHRRKKREIRKSNRKDTKEERAREEKEKTIRPPAKANENDK